MKIQLLKENLQQAAAVVSRFTAQKAQLPVLAQVAIKAKDGEIYMSGTDLDIGVQLRVGGKVIEAGEVGVPAKLLLELVGALPLGTVELAVVKPAMLEVRAGRVRAKLQGTTLADFPALTGASEGVALGEFEVERWVGALKKVDYAVSRDESRPVLTGVLWELKRGRLVATDGYRLSVAEGEGFKAIKEGIVAERLLMSGVFIREGIKVAEDGGEKKLILNYLAEKKQVQLVAGEALVVGRVLEGEYPKYEAIVPASFGVEVWVERQEIIQAVRAAAIFARDSAHIIRLQFEGKTLTVSANAPQVGENQIEVEMEPVKAGKVAMAFNSRYLNDFLSHSEAERVGVGVSEPLKPGVFWGEKEEGHRHVIMPVRVREGEG